MTFLLIAQSCLFHLDFKDNVLNLHLLYQHHGLLDDCQPHYHHFIKPQVCDGGMSSTLIKRFETTAFEL